jgi:predicted TIM-barrel fold metal-dependent hydrolase
VACRWNRRRCGRDVSNQRNPCPIAGIVAADPDRHLGAANLPLQDSKTAIKVMERAMSQYSFRAAQIATYLGPSRFLDDPALDPFPAGDLAQLSQLAP